MKRFFALWAAMALLILPLGGCGRSYSETDLALAREAAYSQGYLAGLEEGGAPDQEPADLEAVRAEGYAEGYAQGLEAGQQALSSLADPYQAGYETGYAAGYARQEADAGQALQLYEASMTGPGAGQTPAVSPSQPAPSEPTEETVYVTNSGTKYHRSDCAHLSQSRIAKTLSEAKAAGYSPCKTCQPPQ